MQKTITFRNQFFLAVVALFLSFSISNAQTYEFTNGGGDGLWNNASNWDQGAVPGATDDVRILNGLTATIGVGTNAVGAQLIINSGGGTLIIDGTLTLAHSGPYAIRLQPGDIVNNGTLTIVPSGTGNYAEAIEMQNLGTHPGNLITNNGTIVINDVDNEAIHMGQNNYNNTFENNGEVLLGPDIGRGTNGFLTTTINNNAGASFSILGTDAEEGLRGTHDFNNAAGATLCIENTVGDAIASGIVFNNSGTYNTSGCTPPTIPTMGEWALIIFGLIVLSFGVVYVMRWNSVSRKQLA